MNTRCRHEYTGHCGTLTGFGVHLTNTATAGTLSWVIVVLVVCEFVFPTGYTVALHARVLALVDDIVPTSGSCC